MEDIELLRKWREGDAAAGDALFKRHVEALYRFFCTKVTDGVDDLVQRTLVACLENQHSYEQRASFRAFLLGIARFQLYAFYRNTKRENARLEFDTVTVFDLNPSPSMHAAESHEQRLLLEALSRLPLNLQIALELSYWEDMSAPELAVVLDIPIDTVYSRLRRARELLAQHLKRLSETGPVPQLTERNLESWAAALRGQLKHPQASPRESDEFETASASELARRN